MSAYNHIKHSEAKDYSNLFMVFNRPILGQSANDDNENFKPFLNKTGELITWYNGEENHD